MRRPPLFQTRPSNTIQPTSYLKNPYGTSHQAPPNNSAQSSPCANLRMRAGLVTICFPVTDSSSTNMVAGLRFQYVSPNRPSPTQSSQMNRSEATSRPKMILEREEGAARTSRRQRKTTAKAQRAGMSMVPSLQLPKKKVHPDRTSSENWSIFNACEEIDRLPPKYKELLVKRLNLSSQYMIANVPSVMNSPNGATKAKKTPTYVLQMKQLYLQESSYQGSQNSLLSWHWNFPTVSSAPLPRYLHHLLTYLYTQPGRTNWQSTYTPELIAMKVFPQKCKSPCVPISVSSRNRDRHALRAWARTDLFIQVVVQFIRVL